MNYRNFASQPPAYLGGSLTANDLRKQVSKDGDFYNKSNFLVCPNNRCDKRYSNSNGILNTGITVGQLFQAGSTYLTNEQQNQQIQSAYELQQAQNQGRAIAAQEQAQKAATVKAYALPIAIAGGALILGIASYFIFKKNA